MQYMHFRASCAYVALAELMEAQGIFTDDRQIALAIKLPWLFAKEDGAYRSGPMLQGAAWFDLWLAPRGWRMEETALDGERLCPYLQAHPSTMLGLRTPYGKHAVVFREYDGASYRFFNPTHEGSGEAAELVLSEAELLASVDRTVVTGRVRSAAPEVRSLAPLLKRSVEVLRQNCAEIEAFAEARQSPEACLAAMDRLFRALFLDGITMLELADERGLADGFAALQRDLMTFLRGPRTQPMRETVSMEALRSLTEQFIRSIEKQMEKGNRMRSDIYDSFIIR